MKKELTMLAVMVGLAGLDRRLEPGLPRRRQPAQHRPAHLAHLAVRAGRGGRDHRRRDRSVGRFDHLRFGRDDQLPDDVLGFWHRPGGRGGDFAVAFDRPRAGAGHHVARRAAVRRDAGIDVAVARGRGGHDRRHRHRFSGQISRVSILGRRIGAGNAHAVLVRVGRDRHHRVPDAPDAVWPVLLRDRIQRRGSPAVGRSRFRRSAW